jgi:hypothetical protein
MAVSFIGGGNRSVRENHRPVASHWQTLSQNVVSSTPPLNGIQTHNVSGNIGTDCIGSCKSNYHTITAIWVCCISLYMVYWNKSDFNVRNLLTVEGSFHISSNLTMACVSKRFVSWPKITTTYPCSTHAVKRDYYNRWCLPRVAVLRH